MKNLTHRLLRFLPFALVVGMALGLAACTNWDKATYQSLAASKAVIDKAASEYNAGQLPQTAAIRDLIAHARTAQTAAVNAFQAYAAAKLVGSADAQTQQAAVSTLVGDVTALVGQIQAILAHGPPGGAAAKPST